MVKQRRVYMPTFKYDILTPLFGYLLSKLEPTTDNLNGLIPILMRNVGFLTEEFGYINSIFGTISLYKGLKKKH